MSTPGLAALLDSMGRAAVDAARVLALAGTAQKDAALRAAAAALRRRESAILDANARDLESAREAGLGAAMLDRLALDPARLVSIAASVEQVAELPDPIGTVLAEWTRPNGLRIQRVRVPLGVIAIIYESRPNVTSDAGALCLKSGNAAILRGGSESANSNAAIHAAMVEGLEAAGLPAACMQLVPTTDRAAVGELLKAQDWLDLIVPRGGRSLIDRVTQESRVPVLRHYDGICHVYVDRDADVAMARDLVANAKMRRVSVCGAAETLLIDRAALDTHLTPVLAKLHELGCEVRGDDEVQKRDPRAVAATEKDWRTEYLEPIISVATVDGVDGAIQHIARYGSQHTESIVTDNETTAQRFLGEVDSAIVMHNASTQFADGGEFGLGAEIGISTNRMHARGPVGLVELTTYKNIVRGKGTLRP